MQQEVFSGSMPRIFTTNPASPDEGRTFVWDKTKWFERVEGPTGATAFTPVADTEQDLRDLLSQEWLSTGQSTELTEVDGDFADVVRGEFKDAPVLYPEAPELSNQSVEAEE